KGFISQIERHRATPSLAKLRLMAERLRMPLGHFTGDLLPMEVTYLRKSADLAVKAKEPLRALALVAEAYSHSTTANERADLERIKGTALDALGQLADALAAHQAAAATAATDAESLLRIANAHMGLGVTARAKGHLDEAIEHCNRALEIHARIKQERDANRILNNIGDVHYSAGRLEQARQYQKSCLVRGRDLGDDFVVGVAAAAL